MIAGVGIDIIEVDRIRRAIDRWGQRFLSRVYTPEEIRYCRARRRPELSFAARFAAKEAAMKALGRGPRGGIRWKSLEVVNLPSGAPVIRPHPRLQPLLGRRRLLISLTHTRRQAMAAALLVDHDETDTTKDLLTEARSVAASLSPESGAAEVI
jgi:holo-[acyl-carrier protein] synthase